MANVTVAELKASVVNLGGNLDQLFLLVMGCIIFCKYVFDFRCDFGETTTMNISKRESELVYWPRDRTPISNLKKLREESGIKSQNAKLVEEEFKTFFCF